MPNQLTILGCGSAKPTKTNTPSAQLLDLRDKHFLIDCGEGTQITMQQIAVHQSRLNNIFISHLHGDHCFGLIGLLSTWGMLGRTRPITIFAQPDLERLMKPLLAYFGDRMPYDIIFEPINPNKHALIYEDRSLTVHTIPLKHSVPCCGFLFTEKPRERHIIPELIDVYQIPRAKIPEIKSGADFLTADNRLIKNEHLTTPPTPSIRYAYCSDTAYSEKIIPLIEGVTWLYHEATYLDKDQQKARERYHSTARQAATIAQKANVKNLIIGHFSSAVKDQTELLREAQTIFPNTLLAQERTIYPL